MNKRTLLILYCLFNICGAGLAGIQSEVIKTRLSENIYKLHVNQFVNMVIFIGEEGVMLIDTGFEETAGT